MKIRLSTLLLLASSGCYGRIDVVARDASTTADAAVDASADAGPSTDAPVCVGGVTTLHLGTSWPITARGCVSVTPPSHVEPSGVVIDCTVTEHSTDGAALACDSAHGRRRLGATDCFVDQVPLRTGESAPSTGHGFYARLGGADCAGQVVFTRGDEPAANVALTLDCVRRQTSNHATEPLTCGGAVGATCHPTHADGNASCDPSAPSSACFLGTEVLLETNNAECASGACLVDRYDERGDPTGAQRASHIGCTCRCAGLPGVTNGLDPASLCACPSGYTCSALAGPAFGAAAGTYCARVGSSS